jgi:outer membrane protein OmpA-like peptidoglycan-associated protein
MCLTNRRTLPSAVCPVLLALSVLLSCSWAEFNRTALLIDVPTADVLPFGSLVVTGKGSSSVGPSGSIPNPGLESDFSIRFAPANRLELALSAYTRADYVLGASYQILAGKGLRPSLAIGIHDIGLQANVSSIGHGNDVWPDERYPDKPAENFSAFVAATVPVGALARVSAGVGRGRYVGYGENSKYLNSDYFFSTHHQWALGLFGGVEMNIGRYASVALEADGRDVNAGIRTNLGPATVSLAMTKIEGLLSPRKFQRVSFAVSYRADDLLHRRSGMRPPTPQPPQFGNLLGRILDAKTGYPILAEISLTSGRKVTSDSLGGFQFEQLPPGAQVVMAEKPGYLSKTTTAEVLRDATVLLELRLEPDPAAYRLPEPPAPLAALPPETQVVPKLAELHLAPVYFGFDRSDLTPQASAVLREHARLLQANPNVVVAILGRACELGTETYNLGLSKRRAKATYDYLVSFGIASERMSVRGLGRTPGQPRWQSRRCEFETGVK